MKTKIQMRGHSFTGTIPLLALFLSAFCAQAQTSFDASLDPFQSVPPHNTPGYGSADFTLNPIAMTLTVVANTGQYADLLGGATSVRVADAGPGTNGPTLFSLTLDTPGQTSGTFSGSGPLTASQVNDLYAGGLYVNISDSVYPSGEIRGQILAVPEPATMTFVGVGTLILLVSHKKSIKE